MRNIVTDNVAYDEFIVLDKHNNIVTGLTDGNFTKNLYDPDGNERANTTSPITVTVNELGNGAYRVNFTPDKDGNWFLILYHATYFDYGKGENYFSTDSSIASIADTLKRIVGLCQENYRIINPVYDNRRNMISGTIRLYPTPTDVDNDTNPIAEYQIVASHNNKNHVTGYKVKRVL